MSVHSDLPNGSLEAELTFAEEPADAELERMRELLHDFVRLGALGGYADAQLSPGRSSMLTAAERFGPTTIMLRLVRVSTSRSARTVLERLVQHFHEHLVPVRRLVLRTSFDSRWEDSNFTLFDAPPPPFRVERTVRSGASIEVEFRSPLRNVDVDYVEELWRVWTKLVEVGAFRPPGEPRADSKLQFRAPTFSERSFAARAAAGAGHSAAVNVLVNALARLHSRSEVVRVRIG